MRNEFVPYTESLALKELEFNEPCFGYRNQNNNLYIYNFQLHIDEFFNSCQSNVIKAPTFSQAFRWFREKHGLVFNLVGSGPYYPSIALTYMDGDSDIELYEFDTYEEAELACLKKLIEIVKK